MKYRAQHWKDVPGVKYPEPPPEPQPPEGWVSTREAVARLGMVYHNMSSTKLHQKGIRAQRWRGAKGHWQLVWWAEDVANAQKPPLGGRIGATRQKPPKNAQQAKVASVPMKEGKPPCQVYAKVGKR